MVGIIKGLTYRVLRESQAPNDLWSYAICVQNKEFRIPVSNISNQFRREESEGLGLLKSENELETLNVKQYLKIRAKF